MTKVENKRVSFDFLPKFKYCPLKSQIVFLFFIFYFLFLIKESFNLWRFDNSFLLSD